jgi:hypothetical protein
MLTAEADAVECINGISRYGINEVIQRVSPCTEGRENNEGHDRPYILFGNRGKRPDFIFN